MHRERRAMGARLDKRQAVGILNLVVVQRRMGAWGHNVAEDRRALLALREEEDEDVDTWDPSMGEESAGAVGKVGMVGREASRAVGGPAADTVGAVAVSVQDIVVVAVVAVVAEERGTEPGVGLWRCEPKDYNSRDKRRHLHA